MPEQYPLRPALNCPDPKVTALPDSDGQDRPSATVSLTTLNIEGNPQPSARRRSDSHPFTWRTRTCLAADGRHHKNRRHGVQQQNAHAITLTEPPF
jgi:hypothetical protein